MAKSLNRLALLAAIATAAASSACGNASAGKTEKADGTEWNVSVCRVVELNDSMAGISGYQFTVADTAAVDQALGGIVLDRGYSIGWTVPSSDGAIWLVAYEQEPILSETVRVDAVNSIQSYGGDLQVAFKFPDAAKWEEITKSNIGKRLAVMVNGRLTNAPQVNCEITSGNCSVTIPAEMIAGFLPNLDVEKLKR